MRSAAPILAAAASSKPGTLLPAPHPNAAGKRQTIETFHHGVTTADTPGEDRGEGENGLGHCFLSNTIGLYCTSLR